MKKYPLIIDCDPGVDDIFAIFMANSKPELDIKAICSVSGNVGIEFTTRNAQLVASLLNLNCIVARGAAKPLVKDELPESDTHGKDGFGGYGYLFTNSNLAKLAEENAIEVERKILLESDEPVYIAAIGPLTNIALLLSTYPEVKSKIAAISIMGGGIGIGNATPCSEFNFYTDPEAAHIVMNSGVKIILAGLDVTLQATITENELKEMRNLNNPIAEIGEKILSAYIKNDEAIHDPCAILAITNPELFEYADQYLQIDTREGITRGMSYVDVREKCKEQPNCRVLYKMNQEYFRNSIVNSLSIKKH